jgi:hypothetical protein
MRHNSLATAVLRTRQPRSSRRTRTGTRGIGSHGSPLAVDGEGDGDVHRMAVRAAVGA